METFRFLDFAAAASALETFLSGMETSWERVAKQNVGVPLKPSLVEWKRALTASRPSLRSSP